METALADAVLALHTLFALTVVALVPLILLGVWREWRWVGNPWVRGLHLAAMFGVAAESWLDIPCPLTVWESRLRLAAGEAGYERGFIADWLGGLLFYDLPGWVFTVLYTLFALLIAGLFFLAPVRWAEMRRKA